MKDSKNENGARVVDVSPPAENGDPSGRWSIEERDQLLLREREARLEAEVMRDANLALTQDLSLERILEALLDYLRKLVPFDSATVMLVGSDSYFVTSAIRGYEDFLDDISLAKGNSYNPLTNALLSQICETRQSLLISDTKDEPRWQSASGSVHIRNWIGVPLFAHDEIIGLYSLDKAQPGYFTAEHVRKAELLAAQAATAIQNAQLFGRVEKYARELEERIADQKQVEQKLALGEELFREAFDRAPLGMVLNSPDGRRLKVNRTFCQMLGYSERELMGMSPASVLHPDDRESLHQGMRRLLTGEIDRDFKKWRYLHADGHVVFADVSASAVRDAQGGLQYIVVQLEDVTERKRAEDALREAEHKYRQIFENADEGIFQSTPDGIFISANPALARMHGFDSAEDLIRSRKDISRQIYVDSARHEEFKRLLEEHGVVRGFEHRVFRKDRSKIWISVNARAVRDDDGAIRYYEGTAQDINERKRAEARSTAFAALARKLSGARAPLEAARIIVDTADELFGWDSCTFDLYDAGEDLIHAILMIDTIDGLRTDVPPALGRRPPTARGRYVIERGARLTLREEPFKFEDDSLRFGNRDRPSASIMSAPIRHGAEVVGIFSIQTYKPQFYDHDALSDLEALADHCGAALNRIRAEQLLVESEERFRQMADHFEDVIWITDRDIKKILYINPACEKVFGRSRESLYECLTSFGEAVHPDDRARMERMLERQRDGDLRPVEYRIVRPDGSVRWMLRRSFPIRNKNGEVYRLAGIAQDITERRRAQEELRESEERFRQLSEAPFEAIILHDNGKILEVNEPFCRIYGYERTEVIGKSVLDLTPTELREPLLRRVQSAGTGPFEGLALRKDGTIFRAELAAKTIHYQGRAVRVAAIRDITKQKRNERRQAAQYAVTRVLAESATLAEATPQLLQVICESKRWKIGEFWRVCDGTNVLRCVETWHVPGLEATSFIEASGHIEFAPGDGLPGLVWQSGQPAWIPDVTTDPQFSRAEIAVRVGLRGAIAFPILLGNHTLGVMLFFSRRDPEVDADLLKIMSAIGSQIGQFIERKRAEDELRVKDSAIESSITPTVFASLDGRITHVNRAFLNLFGYEHADEVLGRLNTEFVPRPEDIRLITASLRERGSWTGELEAQKQNGSPVYLALVAGLVRDASGRPLCTMATLADITERRRTEAALRESEERYRDLVENSRELICTHDLNGLVLSANRAAAAVLGYDLAEWAGKNIQDILAPEVRDQFDQYMARLLKDGATSGIMLVQTKSGEIRIWDYYNSLRTKGVSAPIVRGMARDITEQRRAQKALYESEERYRELFENARDAIYVHDLSGRYTSINRAAEELSGYRREEIIGRHYSNFVAPSHLKYARESFCRKLDETLETNYEAEIISKNGRRTPVEISSRLIYENGVPVGIQGTARDISERKQTQEALRVYSRALIEAQETERQNIARELHDEIGQVLTAIRINLEAIRGSCQTDGCQPQIADSIVVVDEALERVRDLSLELRPSLLDNLGLNAALRWYVDRYAQRTGIGAVVRSSPREQRLGREVETACFRIVQEALTNVARHAKAKRVTVHLKKIRGRLMLTVKDDGIGFDREILNNSPTTALGLRGMEERAHSVGGSIEIRSELLKGTQIMAAFPIEIESKAQ